MLYLLKLNTYVLCDIYLWLSFIINIYFIIAKIKYNSGYITTQNC